MSESFVPELHTARRISSYLSLSDELELHELNCREVMSVRVPLSYSSRRTNQISDLHVNLLLSKKKRCGCLARRASRIKSQKQRGLNYPGLLKIVFITSR